MKSKVYILIFINIYFNLSQAEEITNGKELYSICATCHGSDGKSAVMAAYPKIAGQNQEYLVNALKAYRDGKRTGGYAGIMSASVKTLSDDDIVSLAAYISGL